MVEYFDKNNKKLRKGFYMDNYKNRITYFTGEYTSDKSPIFEDEKNLDNSRPLNPIYIAQELIRMARKETRIKLSKLKKRTNWLEKRLE